MRVDISMPHLGDGDEPLKIISWLKQVGDQVERGEAIAEIETDKSTIELEAFQTGTLAGIVGGEVEVDVFAGRTEGDDHPGTPSRSHWFSACRRRLAVRRALVNWKSPP